MKRAFVIQLTKALFYIVQSTKMTTKNGHLAQISTYSVYISPRLTIINIYFYTFAEH